MIKIVEATTKKQLKLFATYPLKLYKGNPYYVPAFIDDDMVITDPKKNLALANSKVKCFLAYKDDELVGRIAGIIPVDANIKFNEKDIRFSRIEFINDIEVLKALLNAVAEYGKENGLETISGPWGFNDTDREGMLTYGFEELSNYATNWSFPYYVKLFEELGFKKESEWIEYRFDVEHTDPKFSKYAVKCREQGYRDLTEKLSVKQIIKQYGDSFFDCYNKAYANLDNFVKIEGDAKNSIMSQFSTIINRKFFSVIVNEEDKVVAFGVGLPHLGKALRIGKGRLIWSALPILWTVHFPKIIELALIGIDPAYTNQGVHSMVVDRFINNFRKYHIKNVWMDPVLTTNLKMHNTWSGMEKSIRQRRQTWKLPISELK